MEVRQAYVHEGTSEFGINGLGGRELNKMQLKVAFSLEKLDREGRKSSDVSDGNLYA